MAARTTTAVSSKAKQTLSNEQVIAAFNELRQQHRILVSRISEIEMDMKEHDLVIDVLKGTDPTRKCYRMIGGVLVERTVDVVLPGLIHNREKMKEYIESLQNSLESKGKELDQFKETHDIQIKATASSDEKIEETKAGDRQPNILASI